MSLSDVTRIHHVRIYSTLLPLSPQYPPNPVAAYPPHQNPVTHPQDVPYPDQAPAPPYQSTPQPDS